MKIFRQLGLALFLASLAASNVWADRPHHYRPHSSVVLGIHLGDPWLYSPYYYPPRIYSPQIYVPQYVPPLVVTQPPVYVERSPSASAAVPVLEQGFWYYCKESGAYYPYVKQCSGSWQKVAPQPAQ